MSGWSKRRIRNDLILMKRMENKSSGRPVYAGTGKKGKPCGLFALAALGSLATYTGLCVQIGRWWG